MITDNNKKLAQWALDFALKNGCQAAKLVLYANSNTSFDLRNAQMDKLQQASESGLTINLYADGVTAAIRPTVWTRKSSKLSSVTALSRPAIWR